MHRAHRLKRKNIMGQYDALRVYEKISLVLPCTEGKTFARLCLVFQLKARVFAINQSICTFELITTNNTRFKLMLQFG